MEFSEIVAAGRAAGETQAAAEARAREILCDDGGGVGFLNEMDEALWLSCDRYCSSIRQQHRLPARAFLRPRRLHTRAYPTPSICAQLLRCLPRQLLLPCAVLSCHRGNIKSSFVGCGWIRYGPIYLSIPTGLSEALPLPMRALLNVSPPGRCELSPSRSQERTVHQAVSQG